jgi:nucleoside-diphosphate-sugar epimerase
MYYITGIAGTIGSALNRLHESKGHKVAGCDLRTHYAGDLFSILDTERLAAHMRGSKVVYHCAAMLGVQNTEQHPSQCKKINIEGTRSVIAACQLAGVKQLVFLSSSEVYGKRVDRVEPLTEADSVHPANVYAFSKIQSEYDLMQVKGMKITICRMFNVFGPWQVRQFVVTRFMEQALQGDPITIFGNHSFKRSYLYSDDAAQYIRDVSLQAPHKSVTNISAFEPVTLRQLAACVQAVTYTTSEVVIKTKDYDDRTTERDMPWRVGSTEKLMQYSKHRPLTLVEGLKKLHAQWNTTLADWVYPREDEQ